MERQLCYAQERLAFSGGHEPAASMALYALGRSYTALVEQVPEEGPLCGPKALVLYRAAIAVDPRNSLAINELGVLLARCGRLEDAAHVFEQGVSVAPEPQMWQNLAIVHEKLGRAAWAQEDRRQHDALVTARRSAGEDLPATGLSVVRWVEPAEFVQCSGSDAFGQPPRQDAVPPPRPPTDDDDAAATKKTLSWVPDWITSSWMMAMRKFTGERTNPATR